MQDQEEGRTHTLPILQEKWESLLEKQGTILPAHRLGWRTWMLMLPHHTRWKTSMWELCWMGHHVWLYYQRNEETQFHMARWHCLGMEAQARYAIQAVRVQVWAHKMLQL